MIKNVGFVHCVPQRVVLEAFAAASPPSKGRHETVPVSRAKILVHHLEELALVDVAAKEVEKGVVQEEVAEQLERMIQITSAGERFSPLSAAVAVAMRK